MGSERGGFSIGFNTGFLCPKCGSKRVYASLTLNKPAGLQVNVKCGKCGTFEGTDVVLEMFHFPRTELKKE